MAHWSSFWKEQENSPVLYPAEMDTSAHLDRWKIVRNSQVKPQQQNCPRQSLGSGRQGRAAAYSHMAQTEELSAARMRTPRFAPSVTHTPWPACAGSVQKILALNDITSPHLNITVECFCRYFSGGLCPNHKPWQFSVRYNNLCKAAYLRRN